MGPSLGLALTAGATVAAVPLISSSSSPVDLATDRVTDVAGDLQANTLVAGAPAAIPAAHASVAPVESGVASVGDAGDLAALKKAAGLRTTEHTAQERVRTGARTRSPADAATPAGTGTMRPVTGRVTSNFGPRWGSTHYGLAFANRIGIRAGRREIHRPRRTGRRTGRTRPRWRRHRGPTREPGWESSPHGGRETVEQRAVVSSDARPPPFVDHLPTAPVRLIGPFRGGVLGPVAGRITDQPGLRLVHPDASSTMSAVTRARARRRDRAGMRALPTRNGHESVIGHESVGDGVRRGRRPTSRRRCRTGPHPPIEGHEPRSILAAVVDVRVVWGPVGVG